MSVRNRALPAMLTVVVLSCLVSLPVVAQTATRPTAAALEPSDVFRVASGGVVTITTPTGFGSGELIDPSGVIVSNLHVVRGDAAARVKLANGDAYDDVTVLAFDTRRDLVILKVGGFSLPTVPVGNSDGVTIGDRVYAIGAPRGLELTISEGIVSSIRDSGDGYRVIQTTAAISPGSSGGGLFDSRGRLIGITTFKIEGGDSLNFALPINYARGMLGTTSQITLAELQNRLPAAPARTQSEPSQAAASPPSPPASQATEAASRASSAGSGELPLRFQSFDARTLTLTVTDADRRTFRISCRRDTQLLAANLIRSSLGSYLVANFNNTPWSQDQLLFIRATTASNSGSQLTALSVRW